MLRSTIDHTLGDLHLEIDLEVTEGEVVALLGPNGAGKSTVLRVLAGLCPLDDGLVELDGQVLDDPARSIFVPPEERPVGVVFQDYLLFPRLSALDNVAFGLRCQGMGRRGAREAARSWLDRNGLAGCAEAKPRALSGGQAQRVALVRALIGHPRLLLLDEPLAALDAASRVQVRTDLRHYLAELDGGRLLVTHDPVDALVLADRLVVVEAGRITQSGSPADVSARPASSYVAQLIGVNLLHGRAVGERTLRLSSGAELTTAEALPGPEVAVALRPQAVVLHRHRPQSSARNCWATSVVDLEADRDRVRVSLAGPVVAVAEVTPAAVAELELEPGTPVWASVKAVDLVAYQR